MPAPVKTFLFICFLVLCWWTIPILTFPAFAQPQGPDTLWTRSYERPETDESVAAVEQNSNGEFLLCGTIRDTSGQNNRCFLMNVSSQGDLNWFREYGETGHDFAYDGIITDDGGYIIVGASSSGPPTGQDAYIIKTNMVGDTQWTKKIDIGLNLNCATSVVETDSGYIVAGYASTWEGEDFTTVIRLQNNGDTLWTRMYCRGEFGSDIRITSVVECFNGFVLGGSVEEPGSFNGDIYLIRINIAGDTVWTLRWGQSGIPEYVTDLGSNGDLYVVGMGLQIDEPDVLLMRVNASGDTVWTRQYRYGIGDNAFTTLKMLSDNRFMIFGEARLLDIDHFETQASIGSYNNDGEMLWTRGYSVPNPDWYTAGSANITNDGGYILAGICNLTVNTLSGHDLFLIRTDRDVTESVSYSRTTPVSLCVLPCYPNPLNATATIEFMLKRPGVVRLRLYDLLGREAAIVYDGWTPAGNHCFPLHAENLASGEYFLRGEALGVTIAQKVMLLK